MTTDAPTASLSKTYPTSVFTRRTIATFSLALLLAAVLVVSASRSLFYPFGQDLSYYRYFAEMTMAGQRDAVDLLVRHDVARVAYHWLSITLCGPSAIGHRVFEFGWQLLTLAALVSLPGRDGRQWQVGLVAALLYTMAYYGLNYSHLGERDASAVLPLLLMAHALVPAASGPRRGLQPAGRCFFAGALGFAVYMVKFPLGLCFGALWLYSLAQAWRRRGEGRSALIPIAALTLGFVCSALITALVLIRAGWWDDYLPLMTTYHPKKYLVGFAMMVNMAPPIIFGSVVVAAVLLGAALLSPRKEDTLRSGSHPWRDRLVVPATGVLLVALFLTIVSWSAWRNMLQSVAGLALPALGSVLICAWRGRSTIWRMSMLLACASTLSVLVQGWFWPYHFVPLFASYSLLAAYELVALLRRYSAGVRSTQVWTAVCVTCVLLLALDRWWPRMTAQSTAPFVLTDLTLEEHYDRVAAGARHDARQSPRGEYGVATPPNIPAYTTVLKVSQRVRELTADTDPIALLFLDTRIYLLSHRPPVHHLLFLGGPGFDRWYPEFMRSIREKRPQVVLARIPRELRGEHDRSRIASAIYASAESMFGPPASVIQEHYRVAEIIDDVCLLRPIEQTASRVPDLPR